MSNDFIRALKFYTALPIRYVTSLGGASMRTIFLAGRWGRNFRNADLRGIDMSRLTFMPGCVFDGANMSHQRLSGTVFSDCSFVGAVLTDADMSNVTATNSNFSGADLRGTNLGGAVLSRSWMRAVTVSANTVFTYTRLDDVLYSEVSYEKGSNEQ